MITIPGNMLVLAAAGASLGGALIALAQRKATAAIEAHKDALEKLHLYLVAKDAVQLGSSTATGVLGAVASRSGVLDFSAAKAEAINQGVAAGATLATDLVSALTPLPPPPSTTVRAAQIGAGEAAAFAAKPDVDAPSINSSNAAAQVVSTVALDSVLTSAPGAMPAAS